MAKLLMPKATALWLIENTTLTFQQIADFCSLHLLEVQTIADGESNSPVVPFDPVANEQLTAEEIARCEKDVNANLVMTVLKDVLPDRKKGRKYTPVAKRSERPDAIAWFLKHHPDLSDQQIMRLIGTTKATIDAVRNRTHRNSTYIKPRCPITMGLTTQTDLDEAVASVPKTTTASTVDEE